MAIVWECALEPDAPETGAKLVSWIRSESAGMELLKYGNSVMQGDVAEGP